MSIVKRTFTQINTMKKTPLLISSFLAALLCSSLLIPNLSAQDDEDEKKAKLASIYGSFSVPEGFELELNWPEFTPKVLQKVELEMPPFPDEWPSMSPENRNEWFKEFTESDKGKAFQAAQQSKLEERIQITVKVDAAGDYAVYDVPKGDYVLEGWAIVSAKGNENVKFRVDAFGEFAVTDAEEIELGLMPLMVRRIVLPGEPAPEFEIKSIAGEKLTLDDFNGKYLLLDFWSSEFDASAAMLEQVAAVHEKLSSDVQVLSISLDLDKANAVKFIEENKAGWTQAYAGSWEHSMVTSYGVRSSPSYWLIDPKGNLVLNNASVSARHMGVRTLVDVLEDYMSGKNEFAPPEPEEVEPEQVDDNQN